MKDFGLWVRLIAISQLFILVLANYGEGWLAPDNPVLMRREKPAPLKPLSEIARERRPAGLKTSGASEAVRDLELRQIAGWGASEEAKAGWDDAPEYESDFLALETEENDDDESDWAMPAVP